MKRITSKFLTCLFIIALFEFVNAQKKDVAYTDTLGNATDFMGWMSVYNTGRFKSVKDETNAKTRTMKWERLSSQEFDSVLRRTQNRITLAHKIGTKFNYSDFVDMDGKVFNEQTLSGKVVVINFWFVGCAPCEIEMPELNQLTNKFKDNPEVVFLSFAKSSEGKVHRFLERKTFTYPVVSMTESQRSEFKITVFPTNYIIGRDGLIEFASQGIGAGSITLMEQKIKEALNK